MYMLDEISTNTNRILKIPGVTSDDMYAPIIVPGIDNKPSLSPIEYLILFCREYEIVDAIALLKVAKRLLLAATVGANPAKVRTGTIIIPPPSPIIEPSIPATNPKGINHNSSIICVPENKTFQAIWRFSLNF